MQAKIFPAVRLRFNLPLKSKRHKVRFEIHLTDHCNLNCAGCSHFSPLAGPEFADLKEFTRDIARMGEIFSHECDSIRLLGGEPLMHPQINTMMKAARENFTDGNITIVTNGILLPRMGDDFWTACHDNNIHILVSYYPIKLDVKAIKDAAEKFGVGLSITEELEGDRLFSNISIDPSGSQDIRESFAWCKRGNACANLQHGKLYSCSCTPYIHYFNKAFGEKISITESDYIDIYSDVSKDEILDWLCKPVPACRYCNIKGMKQVKWHVSKREISEWV